MAELTSQRAGEIQQTILRLLAQHPDGLRAKEVIARCADALPMKRITLIALLTNWTCLSLALSTAVAQAPSATAGSGVIEGRVISGRSGEYLEKARLTVEGTPLESFTNSDGQFRLVGLPPGP